MSPNSTSVVREDVGFQAPDLTRGFLYEEGALVGQQEALKIIKYNALSILNYRTATRKLQYIIKKYLYLNLQVRLVESTQQQALRHLRDCDGRTG